MEEVYDHKTAKNKRLPRKYSLGNTVTTVVFPVGRPHAVGRPWSPNRRTAASPGAERWRHGRKWTR